MTLLELVQASAGQLGNAKVSFGHGTSNAFDEAAWLVLWKLGLPLDTNLDGSDSASQAHRSVSETEQQLVADLITERITSRRPAAYLTHEAWLQGVPFYVDERCIVPRSLIAELLVDASLDYWLTENTHKVLDLCTGNGSLAVIAAMVYPEVEVTASDLSEDALEVARINIAKHELSERITLLQSDGLQSPEIQSRAPFDLILCNPPYVNAQSMALLPPEYRAEPVLALAGGADGMDFVRNLISVAPGYMSENAVLVLEIGHERQYFEAAFPGIEAMWLETSAGDDQILLLTKQALLNFELRVDTRK